MVSRVPNVLLVFGYVDRLVCRKKPKYYIQLLSSLCINNGCHIVLFGSARSEICLHGSLHSFVAFSCNYGFVNCPVYLRLIFLMREKIGDSSGH